MQHDQRDEIERLTKEFSGRMGTLEQKYRDAARDRDALRTKFEEVRQIAMADGKKKLVHLSILCVARIFVVTCRDQVGRTPGDSEPDY